jgi:predicted kinase
MIVTPTLFEKTFPHNLQIRNSIKKISELAKKFHAKVRGVFMNTSRVVLEKRQRSRRDPFPLSVIYKQLKQLETPVIDEGFDELIIKKDYEQPRFT